MSVGKDLGLRLRSAPLARKRASVRHADGDAGLGELEQRAGRARGDCSADAPQGAAVDIEDRLDRGAGAGDRVTGEASARARQHRDARTLRRSDPSPSGEDAADRIDEGGGLVSAPWERRRSAPVQRLTALEERREPRSRSAGASTRRERPPQVVGRAQQTLSPMTGPTRRARASRREPSRRAPLQRRASPELPRGGPKGTHPGRGGASKPPLVHVRIVVRRSLGLGTTPGASFAGAHGSDGGLSARRDAREQGFPTIDEVSTVMAEDRPSDANRRRSLPPGERSRRRRPGTRSSAARPLTGAGGRTPPPHPSGLCAGRARSTARGGGRACQRREGLVQGLPAFLEGAEVPCGRWQRADARHAAREVLPPKSPE